MTEHQVTAEAAEHALQRHEWEVADAYASQLLERDAGAAVSWLERFDAAVRPSALGGDKYAQGTLGNVYLHRYFSGQFPAEEALGMALAWYVRAARQIGGERMIEVARSWYVFGRSKGLVLVDAASFLGEAEIRDRYKQYFGRDIHWDDA
jgi:hypothetical protein